jgi:hypothetical protein
MAAERNGSVDELRAVNGQRCAGVSRDGVDAERLAVLLDDPRSARPFGDAEAQDAPPPWSITNQAERTRKVAVGTTKKSMPAMASRWLRRKVSQRLTASGCPRPMAARRLSFARGRPGRRRRDSHVQ